MTQHLVFYDASCPLCYHLKKNLTKLDKNNKLHWIAAQTAEEDPDTYPYLQGRNFVRRNPYINEPGGSDERIPRYPPPVDRASCSQSARSAFVFSSCR